VLSDKSHSWGDTALRLINASFRIHKALEDISYNEIKVNNGLLASLDQDPKPPGALFFHLYRFTIFSIWYVHAIVGLVKWHEAFRLASYESLNYFYHLQKLLGISMRAGSSQHIFTGLTSCINKMRRCCSTSTSSLQSLRPMNSSAAPRDDGVPFLLGSSHFKKELCPTTDKYQCLRHVVNQSIYPPTSNDDPSTSLSWKIGISSWLMHSPAFRTAFAARKRRLELYKDGNGNDMLELAALYRYQSQLDAHDRLIGKAPPIPLSGSPDFSTSNSSSIAIFPRMDRSLLLGFNRAVDSKQLKIPDGKRLLFQNATSDPAPDSSELKTALDHEDFCKLPPNRLPQYVDDVHKYETMTNISQSASKINALKPKVMYPVLMQRLAEASCISPLHGMLQDYFLNCYEVSLLNVHVHSKVTAIASDKNRSQTLLSDPNEKTADTTNVTIRQYEFSESMLSIMHDHPKSASDVHDFRHAFATQRTRRAAFNYAIVFILVVILAFLAASGPGVSGFVQYIRKQVSVISIPSLTPMSDFQKNLRLIAPLLWFDCSTNPNSCGLSRLGSVRIRQWRQSTLSDTPCFSSSQFAPSCLSSDSKSILQPGTATPATLTFQNGNVTVGNNGEIVVLLNSDSKHEALWDDLFKPDSHFFAAETSRIEVVATLFSPKLQHFVSFEIAAMFDTGLAQSRLAASQLLHIAWCTHSCF
jgi:hypothetical protein